MVEVIPCTARGSKESFNQAQIFTRRFGVYNSIENLSSVNLFINLAFGSGILIRKYPQIRFEWVTVIFNDLEKNWKRCQFVRCFADGWRRCMGTCSKSICSDQVSVDPQNLGNLQQNHLQLSQLQLLFCHLQLYYLQQITCSRSFAAK